MADVVEDIKARLSIYDVVSSYVQLKKAGVNYKGLCPFHNEKTPSFVVSPEKQIFHCFGCHKGGDIFTFVQEIEGAEFPEALQILADKAGVKIDNISKFYKKENKSKKDEYYKAHELACSFFEKQLFKTNDGKKVLEYLYNRGLKDETIKEFRLGFAPDEYEVLHPELLKKGISKTVLLKSGFISAKNLADDKVYDKFRSRLMFPIFDYMGRICGFGGRALKKDQMPKYLNSPENVIYNKSRILYGLSHSKTAIKGEGEIILVEGYFDVIVPYQEGVKNIVATSGTALTSDQVRLISRFTKNVVTCFDMDNAGEEATKRAYALMQTDDFVVKTFSEMQEKDPADFVKENGGEEFQTKIKGAKSFFTFFIEKLINANDIFTFEGRKKVFNELLPFLKRMSPSEKDLYVRELASKMNSDEKIIYDEIENFSLPADHPARIAQGLDINDSQSKMSVDEILLAISLKFPQSFSKIFEKLDIKMFSEELKSIYNALADQYNSTRDDFEDWDFDDQVLASARGKINVWLLYSEDRYFGFSDLAIEMELEKLIDKMSKMQREKQLREIQKEIEEAEKSEKKEKLMELLEAQQKLLMKD